MSARRYTEAGPFLRASGARIPSRRFEGIRALINDDYATLFPPQKAEYGRAGASTRGTPKKAYLPAVSASKRHVESPRLPKNWRQRLPDAFAYYGKHVSKLGKPNSSGWAQGVCPFHDDHTESLSVSTTDKRGGWRCFAGCGSGDLVGFHSRMRGFNFQAAVRDLLGTRS